MNRYFILITLVLFLTGCGNEKATRTEMVATYYTAFDTSNFDEIKSVIDESFIMVDGEYETTYSQDSFYEQFKWDSVFQPTYKIIEMAEQDNQVIATVASSSLRYAFLENDPLICRFKVSFNSDKISKIEATSYVDTDWKIWQTKVDSLVSWVSTNHPELDGFIHDLSMQGAMDYLEAIDLYESRKAAL